MIEVIAAATIAGAGGLAVGWMSLRRKEEQSAPERLAAEAADDRLRREVHSLRRENQALMKAAGVQDVSGEERLRAPAFSGERESERRRVLREVLAQRTVASTNIVDANGLGVSTEEPSGTLAAIATAAMQCLPPRFRELHIDDAVGRQIFLQRLEGRLGGEWLAVESLGVGLPESLPARIHLMLAGAKSEAPAASPRRVVDPEAQRLPRGLREVYEEAGLRELHVVVDRQALFSLGGERTPKGEAGTRLAPLVRLSRYLRGLEPEVLGDLTSIGVRLSDERWIGMDIAMAKGSEWIALSRADEPHESFRDALRRALMAASWDEKVLARLEEKNAGAAKAQPQQEREQA